MLVSHGLDGHLPIQPRVGGEIHDTHPAATEFSKDFKGTGSRSNARHVSPRTRLLSDRSGEHISTPPRDAAELLSKPLRFRLRIPSIDVERHNMGG